MKYLIFALIIVLLPASGSGLAQQRKLDAGEERYKGDTEELFEAALFAAPVNRIKTIGSSDF